MERKNQNGGREATQMPDPRACWGALVQMQMLCQCLRKTEKMRRRLKDEERLAATSRAPGSMAAALSSDEKHGGIKQLKKRWRRRAAKGHAKDSEQSEEASARSDPQEMSLCRINEQLLQERVSRSRKPSQHTVNPSSGDMNMAQMRRG